MIWFIIGMIGAIAVIAWMVSGLPEIQEHQYTRETRLIHYPDGWVEVEEREY